MNALLNEYRAWRDIKIQQAFEEPVADAEALKEYVDSELWDFHYEYSESITLRQYKECQWELVKGIYGYTDPKDIIDEPLVWWCSLAIQNDDWDALFQEFEPQTDSEEEEEVRQA
jgi:hypothetical protein